MLLPFVLLWLESEEDRAFLERVYLQYHRLMYAQALQITHGAQAAEDAVSDSLMALMKKIDLLRALPCNKLRSYIVITVKHTALTSLSRGKRERPDGGAALEELSGGRPVDERLLAQAGIQRIQNAIRALPARERDILMMKFFRELTEEEIAEETGLKAVSVRVHLSRARKHLAAALAREEGSNEA